MCLHIDNFLLGKIWNWSRWRKLFLPCDWGNFCWLVYTGISHKICCFSLQGRLILKSSNFYNSLLILVWVSCFLSEYHWSSWNPPLLCLPFPQPPLFPILHRVHCKSSSDFQNSKNPPNLQTFATHNWVKNSWNNTQE